MVAAIINQIVIMPCHYAILNKPPSTEVTCLMFICFTEHALAMYTYYNTCLGFCYALYLDGTVGAVYSVLSNFD